MFQASGKFTKTRFAVESSWIAQLRLQRSNSLTTLEKFGKQRKDDENNDVEQLPYKYVRREM
jgi:hypothetical protein